MVACAKAARQTENADDGQQSCCHDGAPAIAPEPLGRSFAKALFAGMSQWLIAALALEILGQLPGRLVTPGGIGFEAMLQEGHEFQPVEAFLCLPQSQR